MFSLADNITQTKASRNHSFGKNEGFPWPWSYQCEFDWDKIKGQWQIIDSEFQGTEYTMEVFKMSQTGENFLLVSQWDENGKIIARGLVLPSKNQRGIMVPMQWLDDSEMISGYWLHISWVIDDKLTTNEAESLCHSSKNGAQLAVKIIPFGQIQDERPPKTLKKILSKAP